MILKRYFSTLKSWEELPTLRSFPLIGHAYLFSPMGKYKAEYLTEAVLDLSKKLGPIFRLNLGGTNMVISTNADHAVSLFRNEGVMPIRPPFPALLHYRKKRFHSVGVVPGNGKEWYSYRKALNFLLMPNFAKLYSNKYREVGKTLVQYIEKQRNKELVLKDIYFHMLKLTVEASSVLAPGHHLKCLLGEKDASEIINATILFMEGLYITLTQPPLWKLVKTKGYRNLETSHEIIYRLLENYIKKSKEEFEENPDHLKEEKPFMYHLMKNNDLSSEDKAMLVFEAFVGGIDATATTVAFTLYYLSQNEDMQQLARSDSYTSDLKFLRACIKETLRLKPTAGANSRILPTDAQIGEYLIPRNTLVSVFNSLTSVDSTYFMDPLKYNPLRWIRGTGEQYHKFASLPFGHGPRMCPGKRIAEEEMVMIISEVLKSYIIKPVGNEEVKMVYRMNRIPDRPINIKFLNTNY